MKKNILAIIFCGLVLGTVIYTGCKKVDNDVTAPTIVLRGNATEYVILGNSFYDAGANASDPEDGDLTGSIVSAGKVTTTAAGTYKIKYTVTDKAGNAATAERTIHVYINVQSILVAVYSVKDSINLANQTLYNDSITVSSTDTNAFTVERFMNYDHGKVKMILTGDDRTTVEIPSQVVVCGTPPTQLDTITYTGSGNVSLDGRTIIVDYNGTSRRKTALGEAYQGTEIYRFIKKKAK